MDTKKGCKNCPFKFCVADNCKAYKKLVLSDKDEIMYIVKNKYKEGDMNYRVDGNKGKRTYKLFQFVLGFLLGVIVSVIGLILLSRII